METVLLKDSGAPLAVLFAGWGMDAAPFADFDAGGGCDFAVCFDYTEPGGGAARALFSGARAIRRVAAWSFGVWAAAEAFAEFPALAAAPERVAVNGTPFPIDDARGVPRAVFDATLAAFSAETLVKFERRMCGGAEAFEFFRARHPARTAEGLRGELTAVRARALSPHARTAPLFTHAVISLRDRVFPPANQRAAWSAPCRGAGAPEISETGAPHYSDALLRGVAHGHG